MRANLNYDQIIMLTERGNTEIGIIPPELKKVGLERLRFDGEKIVGLGAYDSLWVEKRGGGFILHVVKVPGSQNVVMTYEDRGRLIDDAGVFRLRTAEEVAIAERAAAIRIAKDRLKRALNGHDDINHYQNMLILALIVYARRQPAAIATLFDEVISSAADAYPLDRVKADLKTFLSRLKARMTEYYAALDDLEEAP